MDSLIQHWTNQAAAYPPWLVIGSLAVVGLIVLWVLARVFLWIIKWIFIGAVCVALVGVALYLFAG